MPFVLDASTALSLILPEELATDAGKAVVRALAAGDTAQVPGLWSLEVANALVLSERRGRIKAGSGDQLFAKLLALPVKVALEAPGELKRVLEVLAVAREHQLTAYDSAYLCLARTRGLALASDDKALRTAGRATGVPILGG